MIRVTSRSVTVYSARTLGHCRSRLTAASAYKDAAWYAWNAKYPCECDAETGFVCEVHRNDCYARSLGLHRRLVIARLARWLMWRDGLGASKRLATQCVDYRREYDRALRFELVHEMREAAQ